MPDTMALSETVDCFFDSRVVALIFRAAFGPEVSIIRTYEDVRFRVVGMPTQVACQMFRTVMKGATTPPHTATTPLVDTVISSGIASLTIIGAPLDLAGYLGDVDYAIVRM